MIASGLFQKALVDPAKGGCDKLCIISGYATPVMAEDHLRRLSAEGLSPEIELLVGMCPQDGLYRPFHLRFAAMAGADFRGQFGCRYLAGCPPVHSKVYVWLKAGQLVLAFAGSANYSSQAFSGPQMEVLAPCDPAAAMAYIHGLIPSSVDCLSPAAESMVQMHNVFRPAPRQPAGTRHGRPALAPLPATSGLPPVSLPLIVRGGGTPPRSGINWGHRPNRDRNEAYISVPAYVARSGFFPPERAEFTVIGDDGEAMTCIRTQDGGKCIETNESNAILGAYLRRRMGVPSGKFVTRADLDAYGRTDVSFFRIDGRTYLMDFSRP